VRRYVLSAVAMLAAASLAAPATAAVPAKAVVTDPSGDWPVASQDITGVQVSTVRVGRTPALRAVLTLSAAPDPVSQYYVALSTGCDWWMLSTRNVSIEQPQSIRLVHGRCGVAESATGDHPTSAATLSVSGNTLVLTAPYALGLKKGLRITSIEAAASPVLTGAYVADGVGQHGYVVSGDLALARVTYALG
jgi:hypothetical protein